MQSDLWQKDCLNSSPRRISSKPVEVYGSFLFDVKICTDTVTLAFPVAAGCEAKRRILFASLLLHCFSSLLPGEPEVHSSLLRYRFGPGSRVLASLLPNHLAWRPHLLPDVPAPPPKLSQTSHPSHPQSCCLYCSSTPAPRL